MAFDKRIRKICAPTSLAIALLINGGCHEDTRPPDAVAVPPPDDPTPATEARVLASSRNGDIASLDIDTPWQVRTTISLKETVNSVRCRADMCAVVHPDPVNAITLIHPDSLDVIEEIHLEPGSDPRDVAFTDDQTLVISLYQRDYLIEHNIRDNSERQIDLSTLADRDGIPESNMVANCGKQVYVQLQRLDQETTLPGELPPVVAIVDTWKDDHLQYIELSQTPALDMTVDCEKRELVVSEPKPIIAGGGDVEVINLHDASIKTALPEGEFANGGMLRLTESLYWLNQHTDMGTGPSSHLVLVGGQVDEAYNVFATENVDNFVYDSKTHWLFYPNPCSTLEPDSCDNGVHVFHGLTGLSQGDSIDPGFAPIEVVISR